MSILSRLQNAEDWVILRLTPPQPTGHTPNDDGPITMAFFTLFLLGVAVAVGKCLAK